MEERRKNCAIAAMFWVALGAIILALVLVCFSPFSISKYLAEINVIKVPGVSAARNVSFVESDAAEIKIMVIDKPDSLIKSETNMLNFLEKKGVTKAEVDRVTSNIWRTFDKGKEVSKKITEISVRTTDLKKAKTLELLLAQRSSESPPFFFSFRKFTSFREMIGDTGEKSMLDEAIEDARKRAEAILKPSGKQVTEVAAVGAVSENLSGKRPEDPKKIRLKAEVHFHYK